MVHQTNINPYKFVMSSAVLCALFRINPPPGTGSGMPAEVLSTVVTSRKSSGAHHSFHQQIPRKLFHLLRRKSRKRNSTARLKRFIRCPQGIRSARAAA